MTVVFLNVSPCTMYNVQCTMYNVQCTLYNVQCTMYNLQCTMYSAVFQFLMFKGIVNAINLRVNNNLMFLSYLRIYSMIEIRKMAEWQIFVK